MISCDAVSVSVSFQKTCKTKDEMNAEYRQTGPFVNVYISNVENGLANYSDLGKQIPALFIIILHPKYF